MFVRESEHSTTGRLGPTMPRSLVTGATGFVGSNLVSYLLRRGWDVRCLVRDRSRAESLKNLGAELALGQLADAPSLRRAAEEVDVVFHVAGRVHALHGWQFLADNVEGTRNVVAACAAQSQQPVMVYISSLAAGGPGTLSAPRHESDPDRPISAYGRSKLDAERAAAALADKVPLSILRPPILFGPADRASLKIFRGVRFTRLHPVPGLRRFAVSLVHVADLCDAMVRVAERGARVAPPNDGRINSSVGTYHVAAERTITYGGLGKLAAGALGCKSFTVPIPKALFWLAGVGAEAVGQIRRQPMLLNLDKTREALAPGWVCSDEKIRRELGYQPAAPLEQRFAETVAWYREQGWL